MAGQRTCTLASSHRGRKAVRTLYLEVAPEIVKSQPQSLELSLGVHARRQSTPLPHLHNHEALYIHSHLL